MSEYLVTGDYMKYFVTENGILIEKLKTIYPDYSVNKLRNMLSNNCIYLDNEVVHKAKKPIHKGDIIEIKNNKNIGGKINFRVIFEDKYLIVVNKPSKLLSVSTDKLERDTMHSRVLNYVRRADIKKWIWIVHRLDRETSGVMVFAKSKNVKIALQEMFANNLVKRIYYAIVEGVPTRVKGRIESYLHESKNLFVRELKKPNHKSKKAITCWKKIEDNGDFSLLRISIETGKRHQIRVQMSGMGFPIVGDKKYGNTKNKFYRMALHAGEIELIHPITNEKLKFTCEHNFKKIYD